MNEEYTFTYEGKRFTLPEVERAFVGSAEELTPTAEADFYDAVETLPQISETDALVSAAPPMDVEWVLMCIGNYVYSLRHAARPEAKIMALMVGSNRNRPVKVLFVATDRMIQFAERSVQVYAALGTEKDYTY